MTRRYQVRGTRQFLMWSLILLGLGIWCVKDGWFPSEAIRTSKDAAELARFILFNKSLAILLLIGSAICGYIHMVIR